MAFAFPLRRRRALRPFLLIGLSSFTAGATLALASAAWLGCSSSSSGGASGGNDGGGGSDTGSAADSGGTGDSGGSMDGGDGGSQELPLSCQNYCALIATNCTGNQAEYSNTGVCMAMCALMTLGTQPDTTNDTVACRQHYAAASAANATLHCPHAGPTGGDVCGSNHCVEWCKLDLSLCGTVAYPDQQTCETRCGALTYMPGMGDIALTSGNTMNCRIYHLEAAYDMDAGNKHTHCPHTGVPSETSANPDGGGPCN